MCILIYICSSINVYLERKGPVCVLSDGRNAYNSGIRDRRRNSNVFIEYGMLDVR